jgi:hypothetical protein
MQTMVDAGLVRSEPKRFVKGFDDDLAQNKE